MTEKIKISDLLTDSKERLPDRPYSQLFYFLASANGFKPEYDETIFDIDQDISNVNSCHKIHLPCYVDRLELKVNLIKLMEENKVLYLVDKNPALRDLVKLYELNKKPLDLVNIFALAKQRLDRSLDSLTKSDYDTCCINGSKNIAEVLAGTVVNFSDGKSVVLDQNIPVEANDLQAGSDYQVIVRKDKTVYALCQKDLFNDTNDEVLVGGFHYAPGGNGDDNSQGGDDVPQINPFSCWDICFRPQSKDPRGMTFVENSFWTDIYLMTTDNDNQIGKEVKTNINWWDTNVLLHEQGKHCPSELEFYKLAFGTTENKSSGSQIVKNQCSKEFTSKWGVMMSTGCYYVWGVPFMLESFKNGKPTCE